MGLPCEVVPTRSVEHAAEAAREAARAGAELALVAGGDGSINAVAQGLVGTQTALGIIPLGTGNVLARELALSLKWRQAIRRLPELEPHRIDVGRSSAGSFLLMAGIGLDTAVIDGVRSGLKRAIGRGAFAVSAYQQATSFEPFRARVEVDDVVIDTEAWQIVVCNSAGYAGVISLAPDATYYDGLLDLVIFPSSVLPMHNLALQTIANMLWGRGVEGAIHTRCRRARIETDRSVGVQLDGDSRSATPFEAEVDPAALRLLAPGSDARLQEREAQQ